MTVSPALDTGVDESTGWTFGSRAVRVIEIPAHTSSHIAFIIDDAAFTGDTLFAMGCGRLFEGTPAMMWSSLSKLMTLPDATRIFCGHEYTQSNGRFALTLEPNNAALVARMKDVDAARAKGAPTIPSTLGLEKKTNPFLRPNSPELRKSLAMENASDVEVFGETTHEGRIISKGEWSGGIEVFWATSFFQHRRRPIKLCAVGVERIGGQLCVFIRVVEAFVFDGFADARKRLRAVAGEAAWRVDEVPEPWPHGQGRTSAGASV